MEELEGKHADLTIERPDSLRRIAHALSAPVRLQIMQALSKRSMSVGELAQVLDVPMSTTALSVRILEEAGLIHTEAQPGTRGAVKLCSRKIDTIAIRLAPEEENHVSTLSSQMPIGGYSLAEGIKPTCGLAGENTYIGEMDSPSIFYLTGRFGAQLLWFRAGELEYRFACEQMDAMEIEWLEISFEACSEAPMYRDPWKSDIFVSVNGRQLGVWTSPCDCGGRHGRLTPEWWSDLSTQYGFLKTWRVNGEGSYLEDARIGDVTLADLSLEDMPYIAVRIGVSPQAQHVGGINLFGERFGDHPQAIILRIGYHMREGMDDDSK